jgi:hypothetical protein
MTISSPTFTRLQSGVTSADDLRVKGPINAMMAWLSGDMLTQLNAQFDAISQSTSVQIASALSAHVTTRPLFQAHKGGAAQDSISVTATPLTFGTEEFDQGDRFSSSAWTPGAGRVRIAASVTFGTTNAVDNELLQAQILDNGANIKRVLVPRAGTSFSSIHVDAMVSASAASVFTIAAIKGGAGVGNIQGDVDLTWFSGEAVPS